MSTKPTHKHTIQFANFRFRVLIGCTVFFQKFFYDFSISNPPYFIQLFIFKNLFRLKALDFEVFSFFSLFLYLFIFITYFIVIKTPLQFTGRV